MQFPSLRSLLTRRALFQAGAAASAIPSFRSTASAAPSGALEIGPKLYESIGVTPVINCRGTLTIIGGSQSLPEVKKAMEEASRHYVQLDELMEAVSARLAALTGAEWGLITSGCAAALAHITAACMAGADPEKMQRLPNTTGMRNEVIAPKYSRNVYDHAVRMTGAKMVDVARKEDFAAAFNDRTAMVMVLAGPEDRGEFGLPFITAIAKQKGIPVVVDAAAEDLTIPNIHLQRGADIVCYSGGKVLRGPQCAGVALGRKDILSAAWINSAPHHAFGRPMKVGREEIMGMLAAVEAWKKRDIPAEYREKESYLRTISNRVSKIPGVTAEILQTEDLSNHAPRLRVRWDNTKIPLTGGDVARLLYTGSPRIDIGPSNRNTDFPKDSIGIGAHMMMPGDDRVVADRLHELLSNPPTIDKISQGTTSAANLSGRWDVEIRYVSGKANHVFLIEDRGANLVGTHFGELLEGNLLGTRNGTDITIKSAHRTEGTAIGYRFNGLLKDDRIEGELNVGEYGTAKFVATRHKYQEPNAQHRPVKPA
ncbi:MAG TPA: aminotransferase class V-fold PLP-dependent enzyme [Bryobacteraceae bacterium]|nr:aminotransferase class V-fold PLP-dependent enzyme [Bryobacteraceae bacterium]